MTSLCRASGSPAFCLKGARPRHTAANMVNARLMRVKGAVAGVVGIEGGVVSEVINLESSGVEAPDRRPRHDQQYHED